MHNPINFYLEFIFKINIIGAELKVQKMNLFDAIWMELVICKNASQTEFYYLDFFYLGSNNKTSYIWFFGEKTWTSVLIYIN